jgi:hypothetical protein
LLQTTGNEFRRCGICRRRGSCGAPRVYGDYWLNKLDVARYLEEGTMRMNGLVVAACLCMPAVCLANKAPVKEVAAKETVAREVAARETPVKETPLPDVDAFIKTADRCEEIAGEWQSDLSVKQKKEIERALGKYCASALHQLKAVTLKYKDDPAVQKLITEHAHDSVKYFTR